MSPFQTLGNPVTTTEPMRVLILWAHASSPNLGIRALAGGCAELARRAWGNVQIEHAGYGCLGSSPIPIGHPRAVLREYIENKRGLRKWLRGFDAVLDTRSGDSFADIYGVHRLVAMSVIAEVAQQMDVPLILAPQTVGPFNTRRGSVLASRSLRTAQLTLVRDTESVNEVSRLRGGDQVLTTDVVFALPRPTPVSDRDVILNISGLLWSPGPHVDAEKYRHVVSCLYDRLKADGRQISLLAHVLDSPHPDNDVPAVRDFSERYAPDAEILVPGSLDEVRTIMAGAQLVIGSRMHACLNALSVGTPAVPLAYSRKFSPLLNDLGWRYTVDLRSSDDPASDVLHFAQAPGLATDLKQLRDLADHKVGSAVEALQEGFVARARWR